MTKRNPNALSVKMEDALIELVRRKALLVGQKGVGAIATIQADALVKRGLAVAGEEQLFKSEYMSHYDVVKAPKPAPSILPTPEGVAKANNLLVARGGV